MRLGAPAFAAIALLAAFTRDAGADEPRRVAVVVTGMRATGREASELAAKVRAALEERPDLAPIPATEEAFLFRSERPKTGRSRSALAAAKKQLEAAADALSEFDLPGAVKAVTKAKATLQPWSGLRAALELDRERLQLAVAIAHAQRDEQRLAQALGEYAARFPGESPPGGMWPPDVLNRLKVIASQKETVLTVQSEPRATVYVDGREVGATPVRLGALPPGEHRVEIEAPNHYTADAWVETSGAKESLLQVNLVPNIARKLEKAKPDKPLDDALVASIRELTQAKPLDFVVTAGLSGGKLVLRRVDIGPRGSGAEDGAEVAQGDTSAPGVRLALAQLLEGRDRASGGVLAAGVPAWAWVGGGAGAVAIGAGVVMRMLSVSTFREFDERQGALTQAQAYELRDRSDAQATGGTVLLGLGVAAIAGVAGWLVFGTPEDAQ